MFRPGLNSRCRARLGTGIVTHNNSTEARTVQIRSVEGAQWQRRPLTLERTSPEMSIRVKEPHGVVPGNPRKQSVAMLASVASLCPANIKQSTSNMSDSWSGNSEDTESSAESGRSVRSSVMSDGDSANVHERKLLLRSMSGASIVTNEVESKEREREELPDDGLNTEEKEGENEVEEDERNWDELENATRDSDSETHSMQREPESVATTWTDDKHSSFLNSMEATFVRSMYGQGLGGMGVYENSGHVDDSEQDCVESRPVDGYGCCTSNRSELFELLQGGSYQQKAFYRPHGLDPTSAPAVLANPWVQHFKQRVATSNLSSLSLAASAEAIAAPSKDLLGAVTLDQTSMRDGQKKEYAEEAPAVDRKDESGGSEEPYAKEVDSGGEVPEIDQGLRLWQNRLQSCGQLSTNPMHRKDISSWMLKRPTSFDGEIADVFLAKRNKSTQQELAQKDLVILEQYVAKQLAFSESVRYASEPSEQPPVTQALPVEEAIPLLSVEHKDLRRFVGRAMDQVVPLLGRMDSYESIESKVSFVCDLNTSLHLSVGPSCISSQPGSESCVGKGSASVPDLNTPVRVASGSACTIRQPTINCMKEGEVVAIESERTSRLEIENGEDRWDRAVQESSGNVYHSFVHIKAENGLDNCTENSHNRTLLGKHSRGCEGEEDNLALESQIEGLEAGEAYECDPQLSPVSLSKAKTWTWGLRGLRRRLHDPVQPPPSRPLRDGIF